MQYRCLVDYYYQFSFLLCVHSFRVFFLVSLLFSKSPHFSFFLISPFVCFISLFCRRHHIMQNAHVLNRITCWQRVRGKSKKMKKKIRNNTEGTHKKKVHFRDLDIFRFCKHVISDRKYLFLFFVLFVYMQVLWCYMVRFSLLNGIIFDIIITIVVVIVALSVAVYSCLVLFSFDFFFVYNSLFLSYILFFYFFRIHTLIFPNFIQQRYIYIKQKQKNKSSMFERVTKHSTCMHIVNGHCKSCYV